MADETLRQGQTPREFFSTHVGFGYNDMITLPTLTKDSLLDNLRKRFSRQVVYTYVGDIVLSVNPFMDVKNVSKTIRARYNNASKSGLPPHIYALADHAYNEMLRTSTSQSVLISGESGAGKTEAMKIALTYIGEVSKSRSERVTDEVSSRLMQTNPVMEALGNAKTVRNNNSSRFGKHFDVQFSSNGIIIGAFTSIYLLEKPRITVHMEGERNYHVFYMLCKAPQQIRQPLQLTKWQDFKFCNQKGTVAEVRTWNDVEEFGQMHDALLKVGFTEDRRTELYTILASVLHLGNLEFVPCDSRDGSEIKNPAQLKLCAELLQVSPEQLLNAITYKSVGGGKMSIVQTPLNPRLATSMRNSLCAHLYCLVFDCVVSVINEYISTTNAAFSVGLLDIFGFENFAVNSFPQLCINFTNESLQNLFIEHVFKLEQEVYVREEVSWNFVAYEDNQPIIDLIVKRPICILGLLDEGCQTGSGKDSAVLENLHATFAQPKYKNYTKPKRSSDRTFVLSHYAGEVTYTVEGWIEKNKDELSADVTKLLEVDTEFQQLKELALLDTQKKMEAAEATRSNRPGRRVGGGAKKKTVAKTFSESLAALMEKLRATEHHYIRCLKPNQSLKAGEWDNDFMFKQLSYSGTLEVCQIRKAGLNVRRPLKHFYQYYKICADDPSALRAGTVTKRTELLLEQLGVDPSKYRVGKTLLFLPDYDIIDALDEVRERRVLDYVIVLQSFMRMYQPMLKFRKFQKAIRRFQGYCKSWEIRRAYLEVRAAAKLIERWTRSYIAHGKFLEMKDSNDPDLTPEKKRETLLKIMYPAKHGRTRPGLRRRPARLQPKPLQSDQNDEGFEEFDMPSFKVSHDGWLNVKVGTLTSFERRYVSLRQGTITLFVDHESLEIVLSYNLAACSVKVSDGNILITRHEKLYNHKTRSARSMLRKIKGTRWGSDCIVLQRDKGNLNVTDVWNESIVESIAEAKLVDSYKMQISVDGYDDAPINQARAQIIKEGYLRKKKPGNSKIQDMKRSWERRYFVLFNDGKLRYYDSRAKKEEKGSLDLRFFAISEIEEELEVDEEDDDNEKQGLKVQGQFFKIMKGKQFSLQSGRHTLYMASPEKEVADEWIAALSTTLSVLYQKSPLFSQEVLRILFMDGTFTTIPFDENTRARDVIRTICKKDMLNNESEWGLVERWDHPGIPGNLTERKIPNDELLLDVTLMNWEQAARRRFGIVSVVPHSTFTLLMRKVSSLLPQVRSKKEQQLEFCQAMSDVKEGRFVTADQSEIFDLAALAVFKDLREGIKDADDDLDIVLEEGQLTSELHHYLPEQMIRAMERKSPLVGRMNLEEWDKKIVQSFDELVRAEIIETDHMSEIRRIVHSYRLETDLNAVAATRLFIERVRLSALCFSAQFVAEMWSVDKILKVLIVINAGGFHVYRIGPTPVLISSFNFDTLVSWQSMNDMLIVNIIYATQWDTNKRREKLRFLTREAIHMRNLLSKYAEVVLANLMKRMREREMQRQNFD